MTIAGDRQTIHNIFGLDTLSPQDTGLPYPPISTYSELAVVSNLLERRRDTLNEIEYDGLLRVALRLREEIDCCYTVPTAHPDEEAHWLDMIDNILDRAFITFPKPYVNVGAYSSDSDDNTAPVNMQTEDL